MENKEINDIRELISEYLKCKDSFVYFCQKYVSIPEKVKKMCEKCENYEHCN